MGDSLTIFEKSAPVHAGQGTQVEQARAVAEVRAAVMIAMDRPRHVPSAIREMREVCAITQLAERAFFRVSRGGGMVDGDSIHLARELARCWGNIDYGVKELVRDDVRRQSEMLAFAWDLQTNARSEVTFIIPHERHTRTGAKALTGTQEIYENNASFAGRRLREVIFAVLPVWFRAEAADICRHTLEHGGGKPLSQRVADLIAAFEKLGISRAQIEAKRGRKIDDFLAEDVASLGVVYKSISRGEVLKDDEFPPEERQKSAPKDGDGFEQAAAGKARQTEPPANSALETLILAIDSAPDEAALLAIINDKANRKLVQGLTKEEAARVKATTEAAYSGFSRAAASDDDFPGQVTRDDAEVDGIVAGYAPGGSKVMAG